MSSPYLYLLTAQMQRYDDLLCGHNIIMDPAFEMILDNSEVDLAFLHVLKTMCVFQIVLYI